MSDAQELTPKQEIDELMAVLREAPANVQVALCRILRYIGSQDKMLSAHIDGVYKNLMTMSDTSKSLMERICLLSKRLEDLLEAHNTTEQRLDALEMRNQ